MNRQARQWLADVANQRIHHETRQRPIDRFRPDALRPLPTIVPDYRDTVEALVMGCDPASVDHLKLLATDGYGTTDAAKITVVGK